MPASVVSTNVAAALWGESLVNGDTMLIPTKFRFGEGGWENVQFVGQVPRTPSQALTNVDVVANPSRYPADSRYYYEQAFAPGDVTYDIPTRSVICRCFVDLGDANDDGNGNDPEFWELAVYDSANNMIAYSTFDKITKDNTLQIERFVTIRFGGA